MTAGAAIGVILGTMVALAILGGVCLWILYIMAQGFRH